MKKSLFAVLVVAAAAVLGCGKDSPTGPGPGQTGTVFMRLVDAPAHYDQVNIVVTRIQALQGANWVTLEGDSTTYDLMQLRDGVVAALADTRVSVGTYTAIRVRIGASSNVVVTGGGSYPLAIVGGTADGFQLTGAFNVVAGDTADVLLDFDAARSVRAVGASQYELRPVIRVIVNPEQNSGYLVGHLLPDGVEATIYAIQGTDTVTTAMPRDDGRFTLWPLPAGIYNVRVDVETGYRDTTLANGTVVVGQTGDFGDVQLTPQ